MANVVITDTDRFESIVTELENTLPAIEDVFASQNNNYKIIDGTDVWKGSTQEVISNKYDDLSKNYEPICESLRNYIKFLKITVSNYKNYENTVDKTIENNETELNVN